MIRVGLFGFRLGGLLARLFHPLAGPVELQNDRVMHQSVDGCHGGHRILEDLIPLAEDQVGTDQQTPPFIPEGVARKAGQVWIATRR